VKVILYQSLLAREKFEWVLQKCTEVGVAGFVPVISQRSVVRTGTSASKLSRWQRILREAAEQSHRGRIPELSRPAGLQEVAGQCGAFDLSLVAVPAARTSIGDCLRTIKKKDNAAVGLFIGPEGGFTEREVELLTAAGAMAFSLGQRILRTETAAVVASSLVLYELGQMEE
jgi:16S rRNA (uracil1498-N3)-methyltransferase